MRNKDYFKGKKVVVVGLARSGLACASLLHELGAEVRITDKADNDLVRSNAAKLKDRQIKLELGSHTPGFIQDSDLVVISPGVENRAEPVLWAERFNIPVISEIEVAWLLCPCTVIATTGSNGKTTVTTLIGRILQASGKKIFICGNIGNPFAGEVEKMQKDDFVSLEVSSFQLERIQKFKPKISVLLNFSANHLDRHKDIQEYWQAKTRIFMNQDESDFLVTNADDPRLRELKRFSRAKMVYFSEKDGLNPNHAAVLKVGEVLGIDRAFILNTFKEFKGIEHRLEYIAEINKIEFINDSKSTTADSTLWAIKNIPRPIILIAGGKDKGVDYAKIRELAKEKVKEAVVIGEAREKIEAVLKEAIPVKKADSLEEAVELAFRRSHSGECVLLSPMCSSFDMFLNYEERGNIFRKAVHDLKSRAGPAKK
jgi:UDP-N-acetylmuramoylalanine--D-glutamate ligase